MKNLVICALFLTSFSCCREKPTSLSERLLLTFSVAQSNRYCDELNNDGSNENMGSLLLLENNKSLYSVKTADTIHYFRGTYRLSDNGLICSFESEYNLARNKKDSKKKKIELKGGMRPVKAWSLNLKKTGCSDVLYYSEKNNLARPVSGLTLIYGEADPVKSHEYAARINGIPALIDFHYEAQKAAPVAGILPRNFTDTMIGYYKHKYPNSKISVKENDSVLKIVFDYLQLPEGDLPGPYQFLNFSKRSAASLHGDLNGDGLNDYVLQPVLTQGGSTYWRDMFLFLQTGSGYSLVSVTSSFDLAQYDQNSHSGNFRAKEINKGQISGTSVSYLDEDPQCCPSVKLPTVVKLKNNKLLVSSTVN